MPWTALGQSVVGTSHRTRNLPCQDAFRVHRIEDRIIIAVADGAGSASHSEIGAILACDEFVRILAKTEAENAPTREDMTALFSEVRSRLLVESQRLSIPLREIACTALVAVVGSKSACFAQIGDGAIVLGSGQDYRTVFWPEPGEYANTTDFLTDDRFAECVRFETIIDPIVEVAALTDGLQRLALDYASRSAHGGFFGPLFNDLRTSADPDALVEPLRTFLDSPRVNERTDDDKTIVVAVHHR